MSAAEQAMTKAFGMTDEMRRVARDLAVPRLWSMTVPANVRSIAVMRRLGMVEHGRFSHPRFAEGDRLREHVAYVQELRD